LLASATGINLTILAIAVGFYIRLLEYVLVQLKCYKSGERARLQSIIEDKTGEFSKQK